MQVDDRVVFLKDVNIGMDGMVLFTINKGDTGIITDIHGVENDVFKRKPQYIIYLEKDKERVGIPIDEMKSVCRLS
ncbi:hypothetical protein [Paenibacillus polymyxa]|uniref:hypothetical protein n=1 Tax=Paenibacillus polymyxa TaxID=1406 RepID=UPI002AB3C7D6|nr:hypothetical protein [Paenibacillus polymyxa]MDY8021201.1 hypothetical protein [Paenibacillus polymyxa]